MKLRRRASSTIRFIGTGDRTSGQVEWLAPCLCSTYSAAPCDLRFALRSSRRNTPLRQNEAALHPVCTYISHVRSQLNARVLSRSTVLLDNCQSIGPPQLEADAPPWEF